MLQGQDGILQKLFHFFPAIYLPEGQYMLWEPLSFPDQGWSETPLENSKDTNNYQTTLILEGKAECINLAGFWERTFETGGGYIISLSTIYNLYTTSKTSPVI